MAINLLLALRDLGYQPILFARHREGELCSLLPLELETIRLGTHSHIRGLLGVAKFLREREPDVLITSGVDGLYAIIARALTGTKTKIILRQHGPFARGIHPPFVALKRMIYKVLQPRSDAFVAVSKGAADDMATALDMPREKISVIYNPIVTADHAARASAPVDHPFFPAAACPCSLALGGSWNRRILRP